MNPTRSIEFCRRHYCDILVITLVVLFYLPTVTQEFLYADDLGVFSDSLTGQLDWIDNYYLRDGRPVTGIALVTLADACDSFGGFRAIRSISLLSTACLAVFLSHLLVAAKVGKYRALLAALSIVTAPGFAVYVGWASCFLYPLSAILALSAGIVIIRLMEYRPGYVGIIATGLLSVAMLLISLSIYQITATFFLVPLMLDLSERFRYDQEVSSNNLISIICRVSSFVIVAGISMLLYMVLIASLKYQFLSEQMTTGERGFFSFQDGEWIAHAKALLFMVIPSWFHFLGIFGQIASLLLIFGFIVFICVAIWLQLEPLSRDRRWLILGLLLGIVFASMVVLIFIDQSTTPFRIFSGEYAVFVCWLVVLAAKKPYRVKLERYQRIVSSLLFIFLAGSTAYGGYIFRAGFVDPNVRETKLAEELMQSINSKDFNLLVLGAPKWYSFESTGTYEYSFRGSGLTGVSPRDALRAFYGNYYGREAVADAGIFVVIDVQPPKGVSSRTCTITLDSIAGPGYEVEPIRTETVAVHETFGPVIELLDYVLYSSTFGYFIETFDDWYFNPSLGHIRIVHENDEVIYVHSSHYDNFMMLKKENTDWIWSEKLDKWIQLKDLSAEGTYK